MKSEAYKGWMLIRCEKCRHLRSYRPPVPVTEYRCDCGFRQPLQDMVRIRAFCPCCGQQIGYWTNMEDQTYTLRCHACGAPVEIAWNPKKGRYES